MLPRPATVRQLPETTYKCKDSQMHDIGVGIDTSRYGHYAAFLDDKLQQAAAELEVAESAQGYARLRQRFADLVQKHGRARFFVRLDIAGAYADNLLAWLQTLKIDRADFSISSAAPKRNKTSRPAVFGPKKPAPTEARACARYALSERPQPMPIVSAERSRLRQVALRLQAVVKQRARLVNQLPQLLA